jgi:hypothetical protein
MDNLLIFYWIVSGFWFWNYGKGGSLQKHYPISDFVLSFVLGGIAVPVRILNNLLK